MDRMDGEAACTVSVRVCSQPRRPLNEKMPEIVINIFMNIKKNTKAQRTTSSLVLWSSFLSSSSCTDMSEILLLNRTVCVARRIQARAPAHVRRGVLAADGGLLERGSLSEAPARHRRAQFEEHHGSALQLWLRTEKQ